MKSTPLSLFSFKFLAKTLVCHCVNNSFMTDLKSLITERSARMYLIPNNLLYNRTKKISAYVDLKSDLFIHLLGRKEENVLFNDTLNIFYLRLYGIRHMVKDHSNSERGNPLLPHGQLFPISSEGSFICIFPQTG